MEILECPECGAPAEVASRSAMSSTDGPVEHVRTFCVNRHWFLMPRDALVRERVFPPARTRARE